MPYQPLRLALILALAAASAQSQPTQPQPELSTMKAEFVPGEKTLFYDDFTDLAPGASLSRFQVRGAGVEIQAAGDVRQVTVSQRGSIFPNITTLPANFTFEAEMKVVTTSRAIFHFILYSKDRRALVVSTTASKPTLQIAKIQLPKYQELGRRESTTNWSETVKVAIWIQNGRLRTFFNGESNLDFNQVELPPIDRVEFAHDFYGAGQSIGYRSVRFAESTPDFSQVISSSGRYVTHGILFDTASDRIKPESAPVIQSIAKGLEAAPSLRLLIEGHTDSTGNAASNLDLSRRRAEAVKSVLAAQFKIDAARLSANGLGATKPIDKNDTPQGRAQNRRVEFVKQ